MQKEVIRTDRAPAAIGPYVQGMGVGDLVFTSGQLPLNPDTGRMPDTIYDQTVQSLKNVAAVLADAGSDLTKVIRLGVFLQDMNDFAEMNRAYATFFPTDAPCRTTVEVARLPKDARIEIDAIACR